MIEGGIEMHTSQIDTVKKEKRAVGSLLNEFCDLVWVWFERRNRLFYIFQRKLQC